MIGRPLLADIVDLVAALFAAERGITGKILKPYFHAVVHKLLEPHQAERSIRHVEALFLELEWRAQHQASPSPAPSELTQESGHARGEPQ